MKKMLAAVVLLTGFSAINAQTSETKASGDIATTTAASVHKNAVELESGTRLAAQLQNTLDVRKAKVGDQVLLRTTQAIKSHGRTVVPKGARLVGHVTEVAQRVNGNGVSRIGLLFDRLENDSLAMPISATITSITGTTTQANAGNDQVFASGSPSSSTQVRSSNPGLVGAAGGLLGSTTSTVGSVVGSTTSAVGSTVNSTTEASGATLGAATSSLRGIQISESSSTSVSGGSTLSLQGRNIRLEKGTNFDLVLTQSASAGASRNE